MKDFGKIDTGRADTGITSGSVFGTVEKSENRLGYQAMPSREEREARAAAGRTQGRRGCKMPRLNLAISSKNLAYINVVCQMTGKNRGQVIGAMIDTARRDHPELEEAVNNALQAMQTVERMEDGE